METTCDWRTCVRNRHVCVCLCKRVYLYRTVFIERLLSARYATNVMSQVCESINCQRALKWDNTLRNNCVLTGTRLLFINNPLLLFLIQLNLRFPHWNYKTIIFEMVKFKSLSFIRLLSLKSHKNYLPLIFIAILKIWNYLIFDALTYFMVAYRLWNRVWGKALRLPLLLFLLRLFVSL